MWKYTEALKFFGPNIQSESYTVRTPQELDALFVDAKFGEANCTKASIAADSHSAFNIGLLLTCAVAGGNNCGQVGYSCILDYGRRCD